MKQILVKVTEQWLCDNSEVTIEDYQNETSRSARAKMIKKGESKVQEIIDKITKL